MLLRVLVTMAFTRDGPLRLRAMSRCGRCHGATDPSPAPADLADLSLAVPARRRRTQPFTARCRPRATARSPASTSLVTVEPAPTYAPSPILTGATRVEFVPTNAFTPTTVADLLTPS